MSPAHLSLVLLTACEPVKIAQTPGETGAPGDTSETGDTAAECWVDWDAGTCWDCDLPTTPESDSLKFLNQCSEVDYSFFDNAARIPSDVWTPGDPLPPVP